MGGVPPRVASPSPSTDPPLPLALNPPPSQCMLLLRTTAMSYAPPTVEPTVMDGTRGRRGATPAPGDALASSPKITVWHAVTLSSGKSVDPTYTPILRRTCEAEPSWWATTFQHTLASDQ